MDLVAVTRIAQDRRATEKTDLTLLPHTNSGEKPNETAGPAPFPAKEWQEQQWWCLLPHQQTPAGRARPLGRSCKTAVTFLR